MAGTLKYLGNNKYKLTVSLGYKSGRQIRKCKTIEARTKKEAERILEKFYLTETRFAGIDKDVSFEEFTRIFQQRHAQNLSLACRTNYEYMLNNRILPAFGKIKLSKITQEMIINFVDFLKKPMARNDNQKKCLAGETVRKHYKLIQLMFNKAVLWRFMNMSPCDRFPVDDVLPKANTKHNPILTIDELTRLLNIIDNHKEDAGYVRNKLFFYICLMTGARRGETAGLTWNNVDLEKHVINIAQSLKIVSGKPLQMGSTKTKKSVRVLFFDEQLADLFRKHKSYQDKWLSTKGIKNSKNLVFVHSDVLPDGETKYFNPNTVYDWLVKLCKDNNIPHIGLHSLRAQCATLAASIGVPINLVSAQLGHSSSSTVTANIYVRDMLDIRKDVTAKMLSKLDEIRKKDNLKE